MKRSSWEKLLLHQGDVFLILLEMAEDGFGKAINGIGLFIFKIIPDLLRTISAWLGKQVIYACRVIVRLARLAVLIVAWLSIVFRPVTLLPNVVTGAWMAFALVGSIYGLQRQVKPQMNGSSGAKEVAHALN